MLRISYKTGANASGNAHNKTSICVPCPVSACSNFCKCPSQTAADLQHKAAALEQAGNTAGATVGGAHTSTFTSDGVPHAKREDRRLRLCRKLQRLGYSCTTTNRARWRRIRLGFQPNTRGQRLCGRWYFAEIGQREARAHTAIHRSCGRA